MHSPHYCFTTGEQLTFTTGIKRSIAQMHITCARPRHAISLLPRAIVMTHLGPFGFCPSNPPLGAFNNQQTSSVHCLEQCNGRWIVSIGSLLHESATSMRCSAFHAFQQAHSQEAFHEKHLFNTDILISRSNQAHRPAVLVNCAKHTICQIFHSTTI